MRCPSSCLRRPEAGPLRRPPAWPLGPARPLRRLTRTGPPAVTRTRTGPRQGRPHHRVGRARSVGPGRHKNGPGPTQIRPACLGTPGLRSGLIALLAGPYRPGSEGGLPPPLGGGPAEWCAPLPAEPSTYGAVSSLGPGRVSAVQTEPYRPAPSRFQETDGTTHSCPQESSSGRRGHGRCSRGPTQKSGTGRLGSGLTV